VARTVDQVLQSASDVLFPAELGRKSVTIDSTDAEGDTALHVMAWRNDLEGVRLLLGAGADTNAIGDMGETPLHVAIAMGNPQMVQAMLAAGACTDIRSEFGETGVEKARRAGGPVAMLFAGRNES
jgi:uncharacterized protein